MILIKADTDSQHKQYKLTYINLTCKTYIAASHTECMPIPDETEQNVGLAQNQNAFVPCTCHQLTSCMQIKYCRTILRYILAFSWLLAAADT